MFRWGTTLSRLMFQLPTWTSETRWKDMNYASERWVADMHMKDRTWTLMHLLDMRWEGRRSSRMMTSADMHGGHAWTVFLEMTRLRSLSLTRFWPLTMSWLQMSCLLNFPARL